MANEQKANKPKKTPGREKSTSHKVKRPKSPSLQKSAKKRKCEGPSCSMFLTDLTKKLAVKKKQEEEKNIIQTIIDSITNALPVVLTRRSLEKKESPIQIETLQSMAPELISKDAVVISVGQQPFVKEPEDMEVPLVESELISLPKLPQMPLIDSNDIMKITARTKAVVEDASVNTSGALDLASEIAKHVGTLKKISLIAEEFNQKTAKNLKEIVDSVKMDLLKKLEDAQAEQNGDAKVPTVVALAVAPNREAQSRPWTPSTVTAPPVPNNVEPMQI